MLNFVPVYYHVNKCKVAQALVHCQRYALKQMFIIIVGCAGVQENWIVTPS